MDTPAAFSWRREFVHLSEPHPLPRGWLRTAVCVLALTAAVIIICLFYGKAMYGTYHHMFGEKRLGTYAAVFVLVAAGVTCLQIRRRLSGTRIARFWLAFGILLLLAALDDLVRVHERIDQLIHYLLGWDPNDPITDH